jgi:hypothetical protein
MTGVAEIFSHGCASTNLTIAVYTVKRTAGDNDGAPDKLVGAPVTTPADWKMTSVVTDEEDCGQRFECKYAYRDVVAQRAGARSTTAATCAC